MKKILISIMIIGVVAAVVAGGTVAYFSSTNTLPGGFTTATFDVTAGNGGVPLDFLKLTPGGPAVVKYVTVTNSGEMGAYIKATTGNWNGDADLRNWLEVQVRLIGYLDTPGGGTYPNGHTYMSYAWGSLVNLYIDNVTANNPIMPTQYGVYEVSVRLPFTAPPALEGTWATCDLIFQATQSDGQAWPSIQW